MFLKNYSEIRKKTYELLNNSKIPSTIELTAVVTTTLKKRKKILALVRKKETPFYAYDREELVASVKNFQKIFTKYIPSSEMYYAMKSNPHKNILRDVVSQNFGLDASSGQELQAALQTKTKKILFTGPAKTIAELKKIFLNAKKVTINIDSFTEIKKLLQLEKKYKKRIRIGVRIFTLHHNKWNKFGIKLAELKKAWSLLKKSKYLIPEGIQVHMSWNETAQPYQNIIKEIGLYIKQNPLLKNEIKFIDLGGGFLTFNSEGLHPWSTTQGKIGSLIAEEFDLKLDFVKKHFVSPSIPLEEYAEAIGRAIKTHFSDLSCAYYFEPGRIISNNSMHIILKVEDVKNSKMIITDGGTNMVGWERFEEEYFPIINITHPSVKEKQVAIFGSLCTPHDIWGYFCHMSKIKEGDILTIPNQGAYTYTYAQNFIKPIPQVYTL